MVLAKFLIPKQKTAQKVPNTMAAAKSVFKDRKLWPIQSINKDKKKSLA